MPPEIAAVLRELLPDAPAPAAVNAGLASAVAEQWCGAARGLSTVVALSTGEHVTSGVILNGMPWTGAHGLAGSVGWLSINPVEREDYRRLGGLEAEVSSPGIVRRIIWRIKSGDRVGRSRNSMAATCRGSPPNTSFRRPGAVTASASP